MFICNHSYVKAIIKDLVKDCETLETEGITNSNNV